MNSFLALLAQLGTDGESAPASEAGENAASPGGFGSIQFFLLMIAATVFMMLMMRPRKSDQELKKRLEALKKNDRVVTAGGIIGTVLSIRDDNNTVTLRIDEATNTKMQVLKSAISKVLGDEKASTADS
jgi:preprotein translocase subunit YajC